jgi:hypothetical protein
LTRRFRDICSNIIFIIILFQFLGNYLQDVQQLVVGAVLQLEVPHTDGVKNGIAGRIIGGIPLGGPRIIQDGGGHVL